MNHAPELVLQTTLSRGDFRLELDLRLPPAGISALFGPSGSGKTSALRVLAGLEPKAIGRIEVDGQVWQDSARNQFLPTHRRAVGFVFQDAALFDHLDVQGNLRYGFDRARPNAGTRSWSEVLALLDLLGVSHLLSRHPAALSGGERQRIAIARALAASPRLLLMDEPLAALDAARKAEIMPYLERVTTECNLPVVYVSHAIDEVARLAEHLVLLDGGRAVAQGPTPTLLTELALPLAHGDGAGAVLNCTVEQHNDEDQLSTVRFSGGQLMLGRCRCEIGQTVRVRVQARDVSLTLQAQQDTSILNILRATVLSLSDEGAGQLMVALQCGQERLLARLTQRSCRLLGLAPGKEVWAQIKGVAILG